MYIPRLPDDIVQNHMMPKLMEHILAINQSAIDIIERNNVISDFMDVICIYKDMEFNKTWCFHFGMGEIQNAF